MIHFPLITLMVLIFRDIDGIPGRLETLRSVFPGTVVSVCPHHSPQPDSIPIHIPDEWLPSNQPDRRRAEWFAADTLGLAAVQQLSIDSQFVWFAESDIHGPPEVWQRVFDSTADSLTDGIFAKLLPRTHSFALALDHWKLPTSRNATHCHLMTLYRLSARAITTAIHRAEAQRDIYAEVKTASTILRHGGTIADLAAFCRYSAPRSFTGSIHAHRHRPGVLNHPVKSILAESP